MNQTPWQVILTMHKKIRQTEQIAIRKKQVKTYASFTQLSSSTISKALSFQFQNTSFQNVYSLPIPIKIKFEYNSNNPFNSLFKKPFNSTFRFTRTPKSTTPAWVVETKVTGENTDRKFYSTTKQTELEGKVSYNSFDSNIKLWSPSLTNREFKFKNPEKSYQLKET